MAGAAFPAAPRQGWAPSQPCRASLPHEVHAHGRALRVEAAGWLAAMSRECSVGRAPQGGIQTEGSLKIVLGREGLRLLASSMPGQLRSWTGRRSCRHRRLERPGRLAWSAATGCGHAGEERASAGFRLFRDRRTEQGAGMQKGPPAASAAGPVNVWDAEGLRPALPQPLPGRPASADRRGSGSRLPGDRCGTPCPSPRGSA